MSDFKDRLLIELDQLDEKIEKLDAFMNSESFSKVDSIQTDLLIIQRSAMDTYKMCLAIRFNNL